MFLLRDTGLVNTALIGLGFLRQPLPLLYNDGAVLLGLVYGFLPFMVLPLYATLERMDPALLEAAADLGARPWSVFFRVIVPLAKPGIWAGVALVFIPCLGAYLTPDTAGRRQIGDDRQPRPEPVHHRARLAVRLGGFADPDAVDAGRAGALYRRGRGAAVNVAIYAALAYVFLHLPLVTLVIFSFNASRFTLWEGVRCAGIRPYSRIRHGRRRPGTA